MDDKATILGIASLIQKHQQAIALITEALDKIQKNQEKMQSEIDTLILAK